MSYKVVLSVKAKRDIYESKKYYQKISQELENSFNVELIKTIDAIKDNPILFQVRYKVFRIAFTKTFPFGVHFFVENKTIFIQRVLHNKRFYKD
jgi:plasmid stabilization system protein ParE